MGLAFGSAGGVSSFSKGSVHYIPCQTGEYCEAEMPIGGSDLESAHCLFQLSLKCRLPFRILALPHGFQRCCPHCHTIGGDLATMHEVHESTRYLHHVYFGNVVMTTPVIGEADGLGPAVDASTIVGADMTNNSIEEELRLTVAFNSILIYFRHHQTTALA